MHINARLHFENHIKVHLEIMRKCENNNLLYKYISMIFSLVFGETIHLGFNLEL